MDDSIRKSLHSFASNIKAEGAQRFFKSGRGEYGEGDIFIGVTVPEIRSVAKEFYREIDLKLVGRILHSDIHEERSLALMMLVLKFQKAQSAAEKEDIVNFYLHPDNIKYINNWDLVDLSCYKILGEYLIESPDSIEILYNLANSDNVWLKRIAIVSTFAFIKRNQFEHTTRIVQTLLHDKHDLIRKANGWMLREMGKKNEQILLEFLKLYSTKMPKITLSYAMERIKLKAKHD